MGINSDISGLPRDARVEAMVAALDALNLSDDDRITAMTVYFKALAQAQVEAVESVCSSKCEFRLKPATPTDFKPATIPR